MSDDNHDNGHDDNAAETNVMLALMLSAATIESLLNLLIERGEEVHKLGVIVRIDEVSLPTTPQLVLRNLKNMLGIQASHCDILIKP